MVHDSVMFTKFMRPLSFFGRKLPFFAAALLTSLPAVALAQSADTTRTPSTISVTETHPGDYTVQDALIRLPGVQTGNHGQINLRGVGYNRYNVTLDGQRLSSTGQAGRSVDLNGLSMQGAYRLEWIRVLTPDMDADALGGTLNLRTHEDVVSGRRLQVRFGGGANPAYFRLTGPMGRGSIRYQEALRDDLSLSVNVHYEQDYRGREGVETQFSAFDFGQGNVDVIERVSPYVQTDAQERLGGSLHLGFRPSDSESYYFRLFVNNQHQEVNRFTDSWNANADWSSPQATGRLGARGSYQQIASLTLVDTYSHALDLGGKNDLNRIQVAYNLGWSRNVEETSDYQFPFILTGRNHTIDMEDRFRPVMTVSNFNLQEDGSIDRQFMLNQNFERAISTSYSDLLSARLDVTVPLEVGSIRLGGASSVTLTDADLSDASLQFVRVLRLNRFNFSPERNFRVLGKSYDLPWLLNTTDARRFLESQRPQFIRNENIYRQRSEIHNFEFQEVQHAFYGMADLNLLENLRVIAGIRGEYTGYENTGRLVTFNAQGNYLASEDTVNTASFMDFFPNVQVIYGEGRTHAVHFAYSRTIQRPDYNLLVPYELQHLQQQRLLRGNPDLEPIYAQNFDAYYQLSLSSTRAEAGVYLKNLSNFVRFGESTLSGGQFDGWTQSTFVNSDDEVTLYGYELSVTQDLRALSGFFQNLELYLNYNRSFSKYESEIRGEVDMPGHIPHVFNSSLRMEKGRFDTRIALHLSSEYVSRLAETETTAPSLGEVGYYLDEYRQGWTDLSFSFIFRISPNFRFWMDANNLLTPEDVRYLHTRDLYPIGTDYRRGRVVVMGIRYSL